MAKIVRKQMKIFGSTPGLNQMGKFGSLAAGSIEYTTDPDTIQALSNYLVGWYGAIVGSNSPAIQDMNSLCYLYAYQLAYIMQSGVPEWNAQTTYYTGSFASNGVGDIYRSLTDDNLNNALSDATKWANTTGQSVAAINPGVTPTVVLAIADEGKTFLVNSANGAVQFTLPAASLNFSFTIKDTAGYANTNNITIARAAAESIEGLAASYVAKAPYGYWTLICDGTNWWLD